MTSLVDDSIIAEFVAESREHLNTIEPDLLAMEQTGGKVSQEVINRVFRAIHSIKGGAGFLAFDALKSLSHVMESVLMQVRDGKLVAVGEIMDALFAGVDRLRAMLDDIQASDNIPIEAEMARLKAILEGHGVAVNAQVKGQTKGQSGPSFDLDAEAVKSSIRKGARLYHARAYLHRDIDAHWKSPLAFLNNALSVGQVLDAYVDVMAMANLEHCLEEDLSITLLFGTVLEPDLAALALQLPEAQLSPLDMKALKAQLNLDKPKKKAKPPEIEADGNPAHEPELGKPKPQEATTTEASPQPASMPPASKATASPAETDPARGVSNETLRVRVDLLTHLMNLAGELVLGRNQLMRTMEGHSRQIAGLNTVLQNINQVTTELQEGIMQTRMQPIGTVFNRFPRIIRDMSRVLDKKIEIEISGAEVELDKSIVETLNDPLTHIIRNCADHAIEMPADREASGKDSTGRIYLRAYHEGGQVHIAVQDDGRGIDPRKVADKAVAKGIITAAKAQEMSERDLIALVFAPGFSTAEKVSDISGRGVGMDVVKTNVERLGGNVEIDSQVGRGTTVLLRLPLTLAIIPSMIVGVEDQRFAIPQVNVVEFVWVRAAEVAKRIERIQDSAVLRLRDQVLPLVRMSDVLNLERTFLHPRSKKRLPDRRANLADRRSRDLTEHEETEEEREARTERDRRRHWTGDHNIVVLRLGSNQFGVVVDELYDFEEIVVKPLSGFIHHIRCFSGATIMGDGRVIMILDAGGLVEQAQLHFVDLQAEEKRKLEEEKRLAALSASRRRSIILVRGAEGEHFAVPQDQVMRLEHVRSLSIEQMGDHEFIDFRGEGLPLLRLDRHIEVRPLPPSKDLYLLIPKLNAGEARARAGILISSIVDALDVEVDLRPAEIRGAGLLGTAMVQGHLTLFLDPRQLLNAAGFA